MTMPVPETAHSRLVARWPALLAWLALPALILLLPRGFEGNDDLLMLETLRGGHPAPFLGSALSLSLAWAYTHVSANIPWYGLFVYALSCAGAHAGFCIIKQLGDGDGLTRKIWRRTAAGLLLAIAVSFSLHLTFTIAAITACGMGCVFFALTCRNNTLTWGTGLACGLLIALGYQLRPASGLAVAAVLGPLGLGFLLWFVLYKRKQYAIPFLALAIPIAGSVAAERISPSFFSPEETAYREYNAVRGSLQGFDKYKGLAIRNPEGLKQADWLPAFAVAFEGFISFDENHFSLEQLRRLLPLATPTHASAVDLLKQGTKMSVYCWPLLLIALLSACLTEKRNRRHWLGLAAVCLYIAYIGVMLIGFASAMRVVPRICMPMLLTASMATLTLGWWITESMWLGLALPAPHAASFHARIKTWIYGSVVCLSITGLCGLAVLEWLDIEAVNHPGFWDKKEATLAESIRRHAPDVADKVIIEYSCVNGFSNGADPLDPDPMPFRMVYLTWSPPSPFFYDNLHAAGLSWGSDIIPAGAIRNDVFFLMDAPYIAQLEIYAQRVLRRPVHFEPAADLAWTLTGIYRLTDGPSKRFHLTGYLEGSIFPAGSHYNHLPPLRLHDSLRKP